MRRARRFCALAVVVALVSSAPARPSPRCTECPPGCPMHQHGAASGRPLGCHRGPSPRGADVCVRGACGHDSEADVEVTLPGIVPVARRRIATPRIRRLPPIPVRFASAFPPEPPIEPPRALPG